MKNQVTVAGRHDEGDSLAILVHGTFAADASSAGDRWWQNGSKFATKLQSYLPAGVRLARGREVFHWSGENSDRARSKAASELLEHLQRQEEKGSDYHLVGHSHGGSVVWHALKMATLKKIPLKGLRSWTTVGTPFLQHKSHGAWSLCNILVILLTVILLKPFFRYSHYILTNIKDAIIGAKPQLTALTDQQMGYEAILRAPVLSTLEFLGVEIRRTEELIYIGTFDPNGEMSFAQYFTTREGLVLLGVVALAAYFFLNLGLSCLAPVLESHRIRSEKKLERLTYNRFGTRWLGIWSQDDEAINGLRATLDLSVTFVGKMHPRERVFVSDSTTLVSRPIFWTVAPVFNRIIRPILDGFVRSLVLRAAQGNDRPAATLNNVTPTPLEDICGSFEPLPKEVNDLLLAHADNHARDLAPKLRLWLGQPSFTTGFESFGKALTGNELIHTSYFDHREIAALICCNVSMGTPNLQMPRGHLTISQAALEWFGRSKQELLSHCEEKPQWLVRQQPTRRAA